MEIGYRYDSPAVVLGFASAGPGNAISEDAKENKLRLVGDVANRVWRTGE